MPKYSVRSFPVPARRSTRNELLSAEGAAKVERVHARGKRVGRNEPCPCGSGKKFKRCCGRGQAARLVLGLLVGLLAALAGCEHAAPYAPRYQPGDRVSVATTADTAQSSAWQPGVVESVYWERQKSGEYSYSVRLVTGSKWLLGGVLRPLAPMTWATQVCPAQATPPTPMPEVYTPEPAAERRDPFLDREQL